jgi:hypothetical protein
MRFAYIIQVWENSFVLDANAEVIGIYSYIDMVCISHIDESIKFSTVWDYRTAETWAVGFVRYIQQREFF